VSLPFKPGRFPKEYDPVAMEKVFADLLKAMADGFEYVLLQERNAEPRRMLAYMMVMADGTNWDPGSGRGLYRRNKANTAWVYLG
jgi:hypothetical protein